MGKDAREITWAAWVHAIRQLHAELLGTAVRPTEKVSAWAESAAGQEPEDGVTQSILKTAMQIVRGSGVTTAQDGASSALASIFNALNGNRAKGNVPNTEIDLGQPLPYPVSEGAVSAETYAVQFGQLFSHLQGKPPRPENLQTLPALCETYLSSVPFYTHGQAKDIPLYDGVKLVSAVAAALYQYIEENPGTGEGNSLLDDARELHASSAFLMVSCDISGIQPFIYTVSTSDALKNLRARSFYLEIMLEHVVDELMEQAGLSRCNLLYTGGGHAYLLLPNTVDAQQVVADVFTHANSWLSEQYGTALFIAFTSVACSADDLMGAPQAKLPSEKLFGKLSEQLASQKLHRYSAGDIRRLNRAGKSTKGRECANCGSVSRLIPAENGTDWCKSCHDLIAFSTHLAKENAVLFVSSSEKEGSVELPNTGSGKRFLFAVSADETARAAQQDGIVRIYTKNQLLLGIPRACRIWSGDYCDRDEKTHAMRTFEEFVSKAVGIEKIGVMRADVDDLGKTFMSGFKTSESTQGENQTSVLRTSALSRSLSLFFKLHIKEILRSGPGGGKQPFSLSEDPVQMPRNVTIVYAGGDDAFLVGAWNQVIEAAVDIRRAFAQYSESALHLSAGIGLFQPKYPLALMAEQTAALEDAAKQHGGGAKNAVALFGMRFDQDTEQIVCPDTYDWQVFEEHVVEQKLRLLQQYSRSAGVGISALYKMMETLTGVQKDRINVARLAYQLGRIAPGRDASDEEQAQYAQFHQSVYRWALSPEDRRQLITAFNLFLYLNRNRMENQDGKAK